MVLNVTTLTQIENNTNSFTPRLKTFKYLKLEIEIIILNNISFYFKLVFDAVFAMS